MHIGMASDSMLTASGGVMTAEMAKAPTIAYGRISLSLATLTTPMRTRMTTTTGTSKAAPKARHIDSAVDNPEARVEIAKVLENGKSVFWLDCGNHYDSGQVLLGSQDKVINMKGAFHISTFCTALPSPALQHPDLLIEQKTTEKVLSCEEAAIINAQSMSINHRIADEALDMLLRLLSGTLTRFATYVNCKHGTAWSRFNTPEEVAAVIGKTKQYLKAIPKE